MFFFLSKTVAMLFMPLPIIVALMIISFFLKRPGLKKLFFWSGFGLLLLFSNRYLANKVMHWWELPARAYSQTKHYKLGIVLTGATIEKSDPNDRVYFQRGADRVIHTVQLYKLGLVDKILISGGSGRVIGSDEPEADKFKKAMILMGVNSSDLLIENETRNTYESAVEVKPMLENMKLTENDCVLITSAFHMRRSLAVYRKAGLNLDYFTTDFYATTKIENFLIPSIEAMWLWEKLFKEWIGMAAYKAAGYI